MPKVFLSYASENREIVERYAAELSARGHEVWWDSQIYGGDDWGQTIERELNRSNCVVIFWSKYSIDSPWVRIEAHYARQHNCMVPVRLDEVPLPDEHRMLQAIDGTSDDIGASVDAVQRAIEGIQRRSRQGKARYAVMGIAALALLAGAGYFLLQQGEPPAPPETQVMATDPAATWKRLRDAATIAEFQSIETEFQAAIARSPNDAQSHAGLCQTHLERYATFRREGALLQAETNCDRAQALDEQNAFTQEALGWLAHYNGDHEAASGHFESALQSNPESGWPWLGLAATREASGDFAGAKDALSQATVAQPGAWRVQNEMALFLQRDGEIQQAVTRAELADKLAPDNVTVKNNLGVLYLFAEDLGSAIQAWSRVLELTPQSEHGATLTNIGTAYYLLDDFEAARAAYDKATRLTGDDYRAWANLADTHRILGNESEAYKYYSRALDRAQLLLETNPDDVYALASAASFIAALERDDWQEPLTAALDQGREDPEVHRLAALTYLRAANFDAARAERNQALAHGYPLFFIDADAQFDPLNDPNRVMAQSTP